jgi:UDP-GlcNAc:undecaprenyl-phosphate GlcNAc-1-phosphate transferase
VNAGQWSLFFAATLLPGWAVSCLAAWWIRRHAARWGLVDRPGNRKIHSTPIPLGGGLAIWLGVVVPLAIGQTALWFWHTDPAVERWLDGWPLAKLLLPHLPGLWARSGDLWLLVGLATLVMVLGLVDDRRGLDWRLRLAVQAVAAAAVVFGRGWKLALPLDWPWLAGGLSMLWIIGLVNSFNMLDNMDGLSAGVATIAAGMLAAVMLLVPDPQTRQPHLFVAGFLVLLGGAMLGFLWHNRPPARIFMGDAGSYFIGFSLASIALVTTYAGGDLPRHAILAPLCIFAVPLYDTATVVWIRLRQGRSPFVADQSHFSHRLVELGLSKTRTVLTIYLLTATCGLGALLLHEVDRLGATLIILLVGCVLLLTGILETSARRRR